MSRSLRTSFPGPLGYHSARTKTQDLDGNIHSTQADEISCSYSGNNKNLEIWQTCFDSLDTDDITPVSCVLENPDIHRVPHMLFLVKVDLFLLTLKEVKQTETDAGLLLLDLTGEAPGFILKSVSEEYSIRVGSVIELIDVSIFRPTAKVSER
jgi:hypothetical protein